MHTYLKVEHAWVVGHYQLMTAVPGRTTTQEWRPMKSFGSQPEAAAYVNYLNGGDGKTL